MLADADLAAIGRALGDSHRARFILALLGGEELAAGQLAARAGTSTSLTSAHLARLLESGLVTVETRGRQRYYKIASAQVAESIEALLTIAPHRAANSLRDATRGGVARVLSFAARRDATIAVSGVSARFIMIDVAIIFSGGS